MLRRVFSVITFILLVTSMLVLVFNIKSVNASTTLYTRAEGSVYPSTALTKSDIVGALFAPPSTEWNKTYGGTSDDFVTSVVQTSDGGYALAGNTWSFGAGSGDAWLVKTDASGNMLWNETYGGTGNDGARSMVQTNDGGYALAGYTDSSGAGSEDFWLVKTDSSGNAIWNQTYGGTNIEIAECMVQTSDGGYALTGYTYPTEHSDLADFWLVKTDANGTEQWNQTYGGAKGDAAWSLIQTSDGGYALTGDTMSFGDWRGDAWLVKTDAVGNVQWDQIYGTNYETDSTHWVVQTSDGGYALAGYADGFGWFLKIDGSGNVQWSHAYGGWQSFIRAGVQTSDGGYALAGDTSFYSSYAYYDFWLVKTDSSGNWQWEGAYGGPNTYGRDSHYAYSIVQTSDGGYTLAGCTYYFGAGGSDAWLIKTSAESYNLTITTTTGGITNPPPETYSYSAATMANVTAAPNTGYYFDHWELDGVDVGSTNPITITMNTNHTLEAMFSSIQYTLIITATTEGTTDPAPGTYTYSYGAIVSVQALPNTGYELDHWELNGTSIGSANPVTITMDANHTLHAIFTYSVTILAHCNTEGVDVSVSISFDGSPTGYTTPHTFTNLSSTHTFTVTTTDLSGHEFSQWSTGNTSTTTSVSSGGTYTAYYYQQSSSVGGFVIPVDKLGLLAPYIGLASTLIVATVATAVYVNRVKPKKKKQ